ncbi:MAG: hypothetical protein J0H83_15170 [Candidatus Melainabacteria bacterium]|jgi:hypothetical protein|nr:hypothetical protein [Candidatus Melainabacteria bacterium]MBX9673764.1 hypothetical protein [Candidatus Obscuribacterales bacterium]
MFDLDMITDTMQLVLAGKLFRNNGYVLRQFAIGMLMASVIFVLLFKLGIGLTLAAVITSIISGMVQPFLLKDIKFA